MTKFHQCPFPIYQQYLKLSTSVFTRTNDMRGSSWGTWRTYAVSPGGRALAPQLRSRPSELCTFCKTLSSCQFSSSRPRRLSSSIRHRQESMQIRKDTSRPQTFYDLFPQSISKGPPPRGPFALDVGVLKKEFLQLQARAHPDRHPPEAKHRAEATSAHINEAYKTLQSPLLRAQYLLSLKGIDVANDERAKVEDPELLMDVLDAREQIEEAEEEEQLSSLKEINDARIQESLGALERAFQADDMVTAKDETTRLRYWMNIKASLDDWEKGKPVVLGH